MDWKITATTLFCDTVKKWVPIMVYKDGRTNCGYYYRHQVVTKENPGGFSCHGPSGVRVVRGLQAGCFFLGWGE